MSNVIMPHKIVKNLVYDMKDKHILEDFTPLYGKIDAQYIISIGRSGLTSSGPTLIKSVIDNFSIISKILNKDEYVISVFNFEIVHNDMYGTIHYSNLIITNFGNIYVYYVTDPYIGTGQKYYNPIYNIHKNSLCNNGINLIKNLNKLICKCNCDKITGFDKKTKCDDKNILYHYFYGGSCTKIFNGHKGHPTFTGILQIIIEFLHTDYKKQQSLIQKIKDIECEHLQFILSYNDTISRYISEIEDLIYKNTKLEEELKLTREKLERTVAISSGHTINKTFENTDEILLLPMD